VDRVDGDLRAARWRPLELASLELIRN